jgi:hypothetical protein
MTMDTRPLPNGTLFHFRVKLTKLAGNLLSRLVPDPSADQSKETHINRALRKRTSKTYVEIGVRRGECFKQIVADTKIGIDPQPEPFGDNVRPEDYFFEKTSDDFFSDDAKRLFSTRRIDVALVDGLHEFKQALRDILNLEKYMSPDGVIFVHDCNPPTRKHAEIRDGGAWNGDVWKAAYYLRVRRPELRFVTLDCDWGLGVLTKFGSHDLEPRRSTGLTDMTDDALINYTSKLDYSILETQRDSVLHLKPPVLTRLNLFI